MLSHTAYDIYLMSVGRVVRPSSTTKDASGPRWRTIIAREYPILHSLFLPLLHRCPWVLDFNANVVHWKSMGIASACV